MSGNNVWLQSMVESTSSINFDNILLGKPYSSGPMGTQEEFLDPFL